MSEETGKIRVKILHCGDIHLDCPFTVLGAEKGGERRRELRNSFMRLMQYVRDRGINVVLISGDLFDREYATNTTAELLIREFRNCPDTQFVISPGASDYYDNNPIYTSGRLPSNCYVFSESELTRHDINEYNLTVYGWAFRSQKMAASPLYERRADDISRINIVCGSADLGAEIGSTACPISEADMKKFGADYYALGSRHAATEFVKLGDSIYSYCGALECTGFSEPGLGGANLIVANYDDGALSIDVKQMTYGHLRFVTERIDITGVDSASEIVNRISRLISERKYGVETALRVELIGDIDPRFQIPRNLESDSFGLYFFELCDKTMPLYGTEHFRRDMSIAGEVFRDMLPMLESESEDDRLTAARAFRAALAALENRALDN